MPKYVWNDWYDIGNISMPAEEKRQKEALQNILCDLCDSNNCNGWTLRALPDEKFATNDTYTDTTTPATTPATSPALYSEEVTTTEDPYSTKYPYWREDPYWYTAEDGTRRQAIHSVVTFSLVFMLSF